MSSQVWGLNYFALKKKNDFNVFNAFEFCQKFYKYHQLRIKNYLCRLKIIIILGFMDNIIAAGYTVGQWWLNVYFVLFKTKIKIDITLTVGRFLKTYLSRRCHQHAYSNRISLNKHSIDVF